MHTPSTLLEQSPKLYKEATRVKQSDGEETGGCSGASGLLWRYIPSFMSYEPQAEMAILIEFSYLNWELAKMASLKTSN